MSDNKRVILTSCKTGKRKNIIILILCIVLILSAACAAVYAVNEANKKVFIPPKFETNSVQGLPDPLPPDDLGYADLSLDKGYNVKLCGSLQEKNGVVDVYFTNPAENEVWVQLLLIESATGEELGRTGVIMQDSYVKSVNLIKIPDQAETNVTLKVMGYKPQTYISAGAANLEVTMTKASDSSNTQTESSAQ